MTVPLFVETGALFEAGMSFRRVTTVAEPLPGTLLRLERFGREQLGGSATSKALSSYCLRWHSVYLELVRRAAVLAEELANAGGRYESLDRGLEAASSPEPFRTAAR